MGKKREFYDDCGSWLANKTSCCETVFLVDAARTPYVLHKTSGNYSRRVLVDGDNVFIPLKPQPETKNLLKVRRSYRTLKRDTSFHRRLTYISKLPMCLPEHMLNRAVYEYFGSCPAPTFHGNAKATKQVYSRTSSAVLADAGIKSMSANPKEVYQQMVRENDAEKRRPNSVKQISNKSLMRGKKKAKQEE